MKLAACALFISALAAASPVNTTDSTVTTTVSTTQTFYTTLWQNCTAAVPASAANFTGTYSGANSSTLYTPSATALSSAHSTASEDTTVFTTLFITLTESTASNATSTSSEEILTTTITTNEARATTGTLYAGDGTWYYTGLGACGWVNTDQDYIVAIGHGLFDQYTPGTNPNENTLCGKKIRAYYQGKSVEVTAVDRCEGCKPYDIDFSPAAFSQLADQSVGRIKITWEWI